LKTTKEKKTMWRGALLGLLLVGIKVLLDVVRGVGVPTTYVQSDRYLWKLLRAHHLPPATVLQLDALVGAYLNGQSFDAKNLKVMLANSPEPVRKAAEELIAKT
jgi:hypothetical protein